MLPSDIRALYESYQNIYEENDEISSDIIEEVVEELIEECVEFGYTLDEAADAVEEAAIEYLMELNPYAPAGSKEARAYAKSTTATKRGEARKAAVSAAKQRVKAKVKGAVAGAGIAASIAKDEARRAGRKAAHAVSSTVQKKKAEVKKGVKGLVGKGLRAVAGGAGAVAQKARKVGAAAGRAADRLSEESIDLEEKKGLWDNIHAKRERGERPAKPGEKGYPKTLDVKEDLEQARQNVGASKCWSNKKVGNPSTKMKGSTEVPNCVPKEEVEVDTWDVVLEYLIVNGHADTNAEALYVMSQLDEEMIQNIIETRMDPRGRPASGPMNVHANNKPNKDPKFLAALAAVRAADAKKTPEQRKAELDAYKARKENS